MLAIARLRRSDLTASNLMARAAGQDVTAARLGLVPNLLLGGVLGREEGSDDLLGFSIGISIPLFHRQQATTGAARAAAAAARSVHTATERRVLAEVVDGVSFTLRKGQILGLAGLQGSGTSEVLHALFGALGRRAAGQARLDGELLAMRDPQESVERGVVLLTNDRKSSGLAPDLNVTHSVSLTSLSRFCTRTGWVRRVEERAAVRSVMRGFNLGVPSFEVPVRTLSGGNQQKVYLARCLLPQPRVLLLDEPTRGIDVGAKADIYDLMRTWVEQGIAIVLMTSEMDELLTLSDRILVMHRGRVAAALTRETASKDTVLAAAMGTP